jgi:septal ring factor EnvC (AmiA/AmiB activator)
MFGVYHLSDNTILKFIKDSLFVLLLVSTSVFSQTNINDIDEVQIKLKSIQNEISNLEKELRTQDNQLKIEIKSIDNTDKQIFLTQDKIKIYKNNIRKQKALIKTLEFQIDSLEKQIRLLKDVFKEQIIFAYKYQRGKQFDWLLGSANLNDVFVKYYYFKKVTQAEQSIYTDLMSSKSRLDLKEKQLVKEVAETEKNLASLTREEKKLNDRRKTKSQLVRKIKNNKQLLAQSLEEKKKSLAEIRNILASLEKGRPNRQLKQETQIKWEKLSGNFSKNKGKFNWPVNGKVIQGFGRIKNPELKTVLNNTGIDIQATQGSPVRSIFPGVVSMITYMSGFGNMVIVDHNDGYYTVYAHLDEVFVNAGEFVEGGNQIGSVGDSGSLKGPQLHFEIYGKDKNLNPAKWLKKK